MRFACWITKAADTHSEYVILIAFSTATVVTRTHLSVVLYVRSVSYILPKNSLWKSHLPVLIILIQPLILYVCQAPSYFLSFVRTVYPQGPKPFESLMCRRPIVFTGLRYEISLMFIYILEFLVLAFIPLLSHCFISRFNFSCTRCLARITKQGLLRCCSWQLTLLVMVL
jgi:hypothetical protein